VQDETVRADLALLEQAWVGLPQILVIARNAAAQDARQYSHTVPKDLRHFATRSRVQELERTLRTRIELQHNGEDAVCVIAGDGDLRAVAQKIDQALIDARALFEETVVGARRW
jgi:hypothetical protein